MTKENIITKIAEAIEYLLKNPTVYFSEADIQSILYHKLVDIEELINTGCSFGLNQNGELSKEKYKTLLVHREYGLNEIPKARVDIAILNKNDIETISDPLNLKNSANKYLTPDYILEFGTEKSTSSNDSLKEHVDNDFKKLNEAKENGFLIHFQRNYLRGKQTKANIEKYNDYQEELNKHFPLTNKKIIVLFFKIDLGGGNRRISKRGKIQVYKNGILQGINQKVLFSEISYLLK